MDNVIVLSNDKAELHRLEREIEEFIWDNLHLKLKGNWQIYPIADRPIDFIGYRYGKDFTLLRKETCQRFKRLCNKIKNANYCTQHNYRALSSYYGVLKWCDGARLWSQYYRMIYPILKRQGYTIKKFKSNKTRKPKKEQKGE